MTHDNRADPAFVRAMAAHSAETVGDGRKRVLEEHSAAFRWLMASFLAVNGGGLLVLKDAPIENVVWVSLAAVSFYVGIVSALAIAWLGQRAARTALDTMSELEVFWTMVAHSGEFDEQQFKILSSKAASATSKARRAPIAGWLSLVSFTLGLLFIALGWSR